MKKIMITFILMFSVLFLIACDGTSGNDDQINIRVAWWGSQIRHDATVEVINLFMEQNPDINIQYEFFDFGGYITALNTRVAADDVWDVFQLGGNFVEYTDNILDLRPFVDNGTIDISRTNETFLNTTTFEGKLVGIASGINARGIAFDPEIFASAGIPSPSEEWTWDDFQEKVHHIHDTLDIYGSSALFDFFALAATVTQSGYHFFDPETNSRTLGFDDPSILVPYIQMRRDLVLANAFPDPGRLATITDIEGDLLVTGDAAMTWVASNQFIALSNAAGRPLQLMNLPRIFSGGESGMAITSSQMFSVSNGSPHPEAAARFIDFFQNDEEANRILAGERGVPIMSHIREMLLEEASPELLAVFEFVEFVSELDSGAHNIMESPSGSEITDKLDFILEQVIFGVLEPEEAAEQFFEFSKETLARNY